MKAQKPSNDTCLGMIEIASVPTGLRALDELVKEAVVSVLVARPVTPARYVVLFEGEVEAVGRANAAGARAAGGRLVGTFSLPQPHPQVIEAVQGLRKPGAVDALGVVQTSTLSAAIVAADGAAKTGEVELIELRLAMGLGGSAFFTLTGEVSSVEAGVEAARALAERSGALEDAVVIPQPDADVRPHLLDPQPPFSDF